jgi:RNA polymerase sigma-70 factor, ECF subfamily
VPALATRSHRIRPDDRPFPAPEPAPSLPVRGVTDVVRRAQAGDEAAFEAIYREHAGRVYALCLRLTASAADAEERVQDVFVRAWQRLGTFRGESAFGSWLHRLAVNVVLAERRGTRRREERVLAVEDPGALERPGAAATAGLSLDLERAIAALPAGAREVFVLYDVEGYSHQEIAAAAGIAEGTSKAQLFRARRLLREMLER